MSQGKDRCVREETGVTSRGQVCRGRGMGAGEVAGGLRKGHVCHGMERCARELTYKCAREVTCVQGKRHVCQGWGMRAREGTLGPGK